MLLQTTRTVIFVPSTLLPGTSVANDANPFASVREGQDRERADDFSFGASPAPPETSVPGVNTSRRWRSASSVGPIEDGAGLMSSVDSSMSAPVSDLSITRRPSTERGAIFAAVTAFCAISEAWTAFGLMSAEFDLVLAGQRDRGAAEDEAEQRDVADHVVAEMVPDCPWHAHDCPPDGSEAQQPSWRAITICWTSSVPSPIVRILASR